MHVACFCGEVYEADGPIAECPHCEAVASAVIPADLQDLNDELESFLADEDRNS